MAGGEPTLTLNDGGTATYVSGSGSNALTFSYTVAPAERVVAMRRLLLISTAPRFGTVPAMPPTCRSLA